jgi:hypothetical protein
MGSCPALSGMRAGRRGNKKRVWRHRHLRAEDGGRLNLSETSKQGAAEAEIDTHMETGPGKRGVMHRFPMRGGDKK